MTQPRRSPRVLAQVPVLVEQDGSMVRRKAETAVINRDGALILCPLNYPEGMELAIENLNTAARARGRVVWCGGEHTPGVYKLGIEIIGPLSGFWGDAYLSEPSHA